MGEKPEKNGGFDKNEYQREYMNRQNAAAREIEIRKCENPDRRLERLADPLKFLKGYFGDRFFRPYSNDQIDAIKTIVYCAETGADEMIVAPRGDWKTETAKGMLVYLLLKELVWFPVIFGATTSDAYDKYDDIKGFFEDESEERSEFVDDFPEICDPIIALNGTPTKANKMTFNGEKLRFKWSAELASFPHVNSVPGSGIKSPFGGRKFTYKGMDAAVRGINKRGSRPDFPLLDDLETEESARSEHQINVREKVLDRAVGGLAAGGETLPRIVIGTVQNDYCLTYKKLKEWGGKCFKAVYKWPKNMDLWREYVEIRREEKAAGSKDFLKSHQFYIDNREKMDEGVEVGNPHRVSRRKRKDGTPFELSAIQNVFNQWADKGEEYVLTELQNEPPPSAKIETTGLTSRIVQGRISGLKHRVFHRDTQLRSAAIDLGKYAHHWVCGGIQAGFTTQISDYGVQEVYGVDTKTDNEGLEQAIFNSLRSFRQTILELEPDIVAIDSGDFTNVVYRFICEVGGWPFIAVKGSGDKKFVQAKETNERIVGEHWFANEQRLQDGRTVWLYTLDSDYWKTHTHLRWLTPTFDEGQDFTPGGMSLYTPKKLDNGQYDLKKHLSFAKHQVAEEKREEFIPGKGIVRKWHNLSPNNHWLDAVYYMQAAAGIKGVSLSLSSE